MCYVDFMIYFVICIVNLESCLLEVHMRKNSTCVTNNRQIVFS